MEYKIYKFNFTTGVHFGEKALDDNGYSFHADTLFSALCSEAIKYSSDKLEELVEYVKSSQILISDAFPYIGDMLYIPKPAIRIVTDGDGNSKIKKKYKKMKYIPIDYVEQYLEGKFPLDVVENFNQQLGIADIKTSTAIRGEEESLPYRVGIYNFNENSGLYIILGYENEEAKQFIEELLTGLSLSGIGGKRSSGLGRFDLYFAKLPDALKNRLNCTSKLNMTLSVSLPKDEELPAAINKAQYKMIKRSGFVSSVNYADEFLRKKDLYVFDAGSCFENKFIGDIYDVSERGRHSVYRYAKPMFMGVDK